MAPSTPCHDGLRGGISLMRLGTRASRLARTQTTDVAQSFRKAFPSLVVEERLIRTIGDQRTSEPIAEIGGIGVFTREIERALLNREIDAAVHSLKDLPTALPDGLTIGAVPARELPWDALISRDDIPLTDLCEGARVGTGSRRRGAQLRALRPDLRVESIRGNLDTRLRKLQDEGWDAIVVAAAGLSRLGRLDEVTHVLGPETMLPAVGQGALAIEVRMHDIYAEIVAAVDDERTARAVAAERAFLAALGGGCQVPIAAHAQTTDDETLHVTGLVASLDGKRMVRAEMTGADPIELGTRLAKHLVEQGAEELLAESTP